MHKITQFFYRFSLYFTAVITGILLVMSMVCMYGYKEYLSGGNYALGNVAVILLAIALGVLLVTLYRKMQGTGQKATVVLFLGDHTAADWIFGICIASDVDQRPGTRSE